MSHPRSEALLDLALGLSDAASASHVRACGPCSAARRRLDEEQSVLRAHYSTVERRPDLEEKIMSSLPKPATSRAQAATRRTARATATERFHATAGKAGSPVKVLVGAIAAVFLIVVGFIVLSPREDRDVTAYHVERAFKAAAIAEDAGNFDLALAKFDEALGLMAGDEKWRTRVIETRGRIKGLKDRRADLAKAEADWRALKAKADACPEGQLREVLADLRTMRGRHRDVPWTAELDQAIAQLEERLRKARIPDPATERTRIAAEFKLDDRKGAADWSGAIRAWRAYLALKLPDDYRKGAEAELPRLQALLREDLDTSVRRPAVRMVEEGKKAEALDFLKAQRRRFELTESAAALEKLIVQYDR